MNRIVLRPGPFTGVKVVSATTHTDRASVSDRLNAILAQYEVTEIRVTQSSDSAYHCLAYTLFYRDKDG